MKSKDSVRQSDSMLTNPSAAFEEYRERAQDWSDRSCMARMGMCASLLVGSVAAIGEMHNGEYSPLATGIATAGAIGGYVLHKIDQVAVRKLMVNELLLQVAKNQIAENPNT